MKDTGQKNGAAAVRESAAEYDWPRFLDRLVHDLREPLRSMYAFTELFGELAKGRLGTEGDHMIEEILSGAERMRTLIDAISGYSLALQEQANGVSASLQLALDIAADSNDGLVRENGARITGDSLPRVAVPLEQLTRLFENLISNALRFRREEPPVIRVSASEDSPGWWLVRVEDNGIGIAPQDLRNIFEPFSRIHGRKYPGVGMGLAICRAIVEKHGGRIRMESVPGSGSTCCFTLPAD